MSTHYGRDNRAIWNLVNWDNAFNAIARRLGCDRKAVYYQAKKRGLKSKIKRGGNPGRYNPVLPYVEGPNPLPDKIPQL